MSTVKDLSYAFKILGFKARAGVLAEENRNRLVVFPAPELKYGGAWFFVGELRNKRNLSKVLAEAIQRAGHPCQLHSQ